MEWLVSWNYIVPAFNLFPAPVMGPSPLWKKSKKKAAAKWGFFTWIQFTGHFAKCCIKQSEIPPESWQGQKYFVFNAWIFYFDISLVKSFCLPFAKRRLLYRCQSGFQFSQRGLKMSTVIPWKMAVTPRSRVADAKVARFIFLALFSNQIRHGERPSRLIEGQNADEVASERKKASDQDLWSEASLCKEWYASHQQWNEMSN